jgi:hypothetical protein
MVSCQAVRYAYAYMYIQSVPVCMFEYISQAYSCRLGVPCDKSLMHNDARTLKGKCNMLWLSILHDSPALHCPVIHSVCLRFTAKSQWYQCHYIRYK